MRNNDSILIDSLLAKLCVLLQLTETQYNAAKRSYGAVGDWLGGDGSPLAVLDPVIYPQGSMALDTTVRPRGQIEYDLDFIFQIVAINIGPMELYDLLLRRLRQHADYNDRLVQDPLPRRCLRLNYAGQFHLDVVPARIDPIRGRPFVEVPDRELKKWVGSNPLGYRDWFRGQCAKTILIEKATQEPLPTQIVVDRKPMLTKVVQLLKRHRDMVFGDSKGAPSSIVITTLAATFFQGTSSLLTALEQVLTDIVRMIDAKIPDRISLCNPTHSDEHFVDRWSDDQYHEFVWFVRNFCTRIQHLRDIRGFEAIGDELRELFGDEVGEERGVIAKAVREYVEDFNCARDNGSLRFTSTGLSLGVVEGLPIRPHKFYGR